MRCIRIPTRRGAIWRLSQPVGTCTVIWWGRSCSQAVRSYQDHQRALRTGEPA